MIYYRLLGQVNRFTQKQTDRGQPLPLYKPGLFMDFRENLAGVAVLPEELGLTEPFPEEYKAPSGGIWRRYEGTSLPTGGHMTQRGRTGCCNPDGSWGNTFVRKQKDKHGDASWDVSNIGKGPSAFEPASIQELKKKGLIQ